MWALIDGNSSDSVSISKTLWNSNSRSDFTDPRTSEGSTSSMASTTSDTSSLSSRFSANWKRDYEKFAKNESQWRFLLLITGKKFKKYPLSIFRVFAATSSGINDGSKVDLNIEDFVIESFIKSTWSLFFELIAGKSYFIFFILCVDTIDSSSKSRDSWREPESSTEMLI